MLNCLNKLSTASSKCTTSLGYGFLESVYKKAMLIEERKLGLQVETEVPIPVLYEDERVGEFFADQVVEGIIHC